MAKWKRKRLKQKKKKETCFQKKKELLRKKHNGNELEILDTNEEIQMKRKMFSHKTEELKEYKRNNPKEK